jgi:hypothetical protein
MNVVVKKRAPRIPQSAVSQMDTKLISRAEIDTWRVPDFQRPLRINDKVRALAEELKTNGGFISGVVTLGHLKSDATTYIVDGQHRLEAFKISELPECIADVRICKFESLADMADEFVLLQQSLVRMRPDDVLRGLEASTHALQVIRQACPYVGYGQIRKGNEYTPVVSMASVLRIWSGTRQETPSRSHQGLSPAGLARTMEPVEVTNLCKFLHIANEAWGRDPNTARLWTTLNMGICMWMYRRMVLDPERLTKRSIVLKDEQFKKCLMAVSASPDYIDWLVGRIMTDFHRGPCYRRIKNLFAARLKEDGIDNPRFPQPAWAIS